MSSLLPDAIASNDVLSNLLTRNWKDGCYAITNSAEKQLIPFFLIMGMLYFGTSATVTEEHVELGALTAVYGASSLAGYFNCGSAPLARMIRATGISTLSALLGIGSILNGGGTMGIWLLTMLHLFDTFQGASQEPQRSEDEYGLLPAEQNNHGPILSFFLQSWRNNSINKDNFSTC